MPLERPIQLARLARVLLALCLAPAGCADTRVTDPKRTATEQFLLSQAAARAVEQLSFEALRGRTVYVDSSYFALADDGGFALGELRAKALLDGVQIVHKREDAQIILEPRTGGVGIDRYDSLTGLPPLPIGPAAATAGPGAGNIPIITPELAIVKHREQRGIASVAYVAYWADTGEIVANSGPFVGRTLRDDYWFFGFGPRTIGNIPPAEKDTQKKQSRARQVQKKEPPEAPSETADE